MTIALIDDQLLGQVLRGPIPRRFRNKDLFTTGIWYVRLCQAVLRHTSRPGVLSQPFQTLPEPLREPAVAALVGLPAHIGLLSFRELAPTIGRLRGPHSLNLLGIEALAAATSLGADVYLATPSPRLEAACATEHVKVLVIP